MLKLKTRGLGSIEVEDAKIITMPRGMIGFPNHKRYIILKHKEDSPFYWYQSVEEPGLAFVIINPLLFKPDYHIRVSKADLKCIEVEEENDLEVFVVVTIPQGRPEQMTANMAGPVVVNTRKMLAKQVVLKHSEYSHQYPILGPSPGGGNKERADDCPPARESREASDIG